MLFGGFKNLLRLCRRKRPLIAENIDELRELTLGRLRNHLLTDELNVLW